MSRVHPQRLNVDSITSSKQEVFTLWMKSLIFSCNGCVVFDSNGQIVYRVDNYYQKCSNVVYIMDSNGRVLFTIVKKKFSFLGQWKGFRSSSTDDKMKKPGFCVTKVLSIRRILGCFGRFSLYRVVIGVDKEKGCEYVMECQDCKSCFKILDKVGGAVAEVKRKMSSSGVFLGEDVLSMVVEPNIDPSLIMGLVVVFGLIQHKL